MGRRVLQAIANFDHEEVVTVEELVLRYFPTESLISKADFEEIRKTAYYLYREHGDENAGRNWKQAMRVVAIRKHLREGGRKNGSA